MIPPGYRFCLDAWENSDVPSICRRNPAGGDDYILCQISRVYRPDDLYELCTRANTAAAEAELLEAARAVVERWDLPTWKDAEPTGLVIRRLREALVRAEARR